MQQNVEVNLKSRADTSGFSTFEAAARRTASAVAGTKGQLADITAASKRVARSVGDIAGPLAGAAGGVGRLAGNAAKLAGGFESLGLAGGAVTAAIGLVVGKVASAVTEVVKFRSEAESASAAATALLKSLESSQLTPTQRSLRDVREQIVALEQQAAKYQQRGLLTQIFGAFSGSERATQAAQADARTKLDRAQLMLKARAAKEDPERIRLVAEKKAKEEAAAAYDAALRKKTEDARASFLDAQRQRQAAADEKAFAALPPEKKLDVLRGRLADADAAIASAREGQRTGATDRIREAATRDEYDAMQRRLELEQQIESLLESQVTAQRDAVETSKAAVDTAEANVAQEQQATSASSPQIVAGAARALGGGGGVFSTAFDPVLAENRRQTQLLERIAGAAERGPKLSTAVLA